MALLGALNSWSGPTWRVFAQAVPTQHNPIARASTNKLHGAGIDKPIAKPRPVDMYYFSIAASEGWNIAEVSANPTSPPSAPPKNYLRPRRFNSATLRLKYLSAWAVGDVLQSVTGMRCSVVAAGDY